MDRLIIESALSDVNEIFLSGLEENASGAFAIVFGFKATHTEQVLNAFSGLKDIVCDKDASLVIFKTRMLGIYDLEIKTEGLDEPIRIMNKAIANETIGSIEDRIHNDQGIVLTTNVSKEDNSILISEVEIKACDDLS
ncbi:hypothetical protein [Pedobacter sp. JCM 36344]|uniref:hypothetical protein n=1 Tax=Pedobacter sp. JCM 36344 TaxID=3374280 RepID=UPI00397B6C50